MKKSLPLILIVLGFLFFAPKAHAAISVVQSPITNNYSGNTEAFASNVTAGNALVISADVNQGSAQSISGSGTGCGSTSWSKAAENVFSAGFITATTWIGIASGSGACTVTITPSVAGHNGIFVSEYSGVDTVNPVDATGTNAGSVSTLTMTGGTINKAGEFGYAYWSSRSGSTPSASGWTTGLTNTFDGSFQNASLVSGTALSINITSMAATNNAGVVISLEPGGSPPTSVIKMIFRWIMSF